MSETADPLTSKETPSPPADKVPSPPPSPPSSPPSPSSSPLPPSSPSPSPPSSPPSPSSSPSPPSSPSPSPPSPQPSLSPSPSYQEKKTPPDFAVPATDPPPKDEATDTQPTENESSIDIPNATSDSTPPTEPSPFEDKNVRRAFVRKVLCIVILMFLFTFAVVCLFTFCDPLKNVVKENLWVYLSSYIIFTTVILSFAVLKSFSRRHPWNMIGLVLVTLSMSYLAGTIASFHDTTSVLMAMGLTIITFAVIIGFSAQDRVKFNTGFVILLIIAVDFIVFGIMYGIFKSFHPSHIPHILIGSFGAFLLSMYLLVDVQLMTGKMKDRVDPEEYVFAALLIYLDIVIIFIWFLQLMGGYS